MLIFLVSLLYPHNSNPRPANAAALLKQEDATVLDCGVEDLLEVIDL
jgi:hypothetical protein